MNETEHPGGYADPYTDGYFIGWVVTHTRGWLAGVNGKDEWDPAIAGATREHFLKIMAVRWVDGRMAGEEAGYRAGYAAGRAAFARVNTYEARCGAFQRNLAMEKMFPAPVAPTPVRRRRRATEAPETTQNALVWDRNAFCEWDSGEGLLG